MLIFAASLTLAACGGSAEQTSTTDTFVVPGPDSSQILPALTDSAKADTVSLKSDEELGGSGGVFGNPARQPQK